MSQSSIRHPRRVLAPAAIVALLSTVACADAIGPASAPDELPTGNAPPSAGTSLDTLPAGRLRGTAVAPSVDSTSVWRPLGAVRLEAATRDARTGAMTVVATTTTNGEGQFVFDDIDTPTGLLYVRAVPASGSGHQATRWLAGHAFVESWATLGIGRTQWKIGPYVVLDPVSAPARDHAPVLLVGHVLANDSRTPVAESKVVVERLALTPSGAGQKYVSAGVAASARTDATGLFILELPGAGEYGTRVAAPVGSPYPDVPLTASPLRLTEGADVTVFSYAGFELGRR